MQIPQQLNEWTAALRDTHLIGSYVIINEKCLSSDVHYYSISTCNVPQGFTILQTRFATVETMKHLDRISHYRLSPSDYNLEPLACERSEITLFAIKDKSLFQLGERLTYVELLTGSSDLGKHVVHIRSSATSFHGRLTAKRADQPQPVVNTIQEPQSTTMTTRQSTPGTSNNSASTGTTQHQRNGTPVEPPRSHSTHTSHHRPVRYPSSWMSTFSRFIFGKGQTKPKPRPKIRMIRVVTDSLDNRPSDQAESSTGASERHGNEADDGGPERSDVYGQGSWYHADGTYGIANDMANYQSSEDSDEDSNEGGYESESSLRASQRGNGALHTDPSSAFHHGRHSSSRTKPLSPDPSAFPSNDIGASSTSAGRPRQRR